jgi:hypothetical protein
MSDYKTLQQDTVLRQLAILTNLADVLWNPQIMDEARNLRNKLIDASAGRGESPVEAMWAIMRFYESLIAEMNEEGMAAVGDDPDIPSARDQVMTFLATPATL